LIKLKRATRSLLIGVWFSGIFQPFARTALADDFAIRDGDTVVFLGDSITAARTYGKVIENYTLLRYPQRRARFINAGWGGDTAAGGLARLDRDVFDRKATLLTVAYGINDIGWGGKADDEHRQKYLDSIRGIVEQCKKHNVRVFICSAALTAGDVKTDDGYLQKMCDDGMAISRSLGGGAIDVQRGMRKIARRIAEANAKVVDEKKKDTMHAPDGIHLNDLGQLAMAFAILKGLGAPVEVSSVDVDANGPKLLEARGCTVSDLRGSADTLEFDRLDEGAPLNFGALGVLNFRFIPIPEELNRYMLRIRNLPAASYELKVNDRLVGTYSALDLDAGVNISSATPDAWQPGGPWDAQATVLRNVTEARNELVMGTLFTTLYLQNHANEKPVTTQLAELDDHIVQLQRTIVKPSPFHFVIRPQPPQSHPGN